MEESVGKRPSTSWLKSNKTLIDKYKTKEGQVFYKLSKKGNRILEVFKKYEVKEDIELPESKEYPNIILQLDNGKKVEINRRMFSSNMLPDPHKDKLTILNLLSAMGHKTKSYKVVSNPIKEQDSVATLSNTLGMGTVNPARSLGGSGAGQPNSSIGSADVFSNPVRIRKPKKEDVPFIVNKIEDDEDDEEETEK